MLISLFCFFNASGQLYPLNGTVNSHSNTNDYVGIGKSNPSATLDILNLTNPSMRIANGAGGWGQIGVATCNNCFSPTAKAGDMVVRAAGGGDLLLGIPDGVVDSRQIKFIVTNQVAMSVMANGQVGIGTTDIPSPYKLAVADGIITEKVKVAVESSADWSDFVFEDDYELASISDVESFIKKHKHLPGVPSAVEVVEQGIDLGKMDATLLQKIEELTLYVIELKQENAKLARKIKAMEQE